MEVEVEDGDTRPPLSGVPTLSRVLHLGPVTQTVMTGCRSHDRWDDGELIVLLS